MRRDWLRDVWMPFVKNFGGMMEISQDSAERLVAEVKFCCDLANELLRQSQSTLEPIQFSEFRRVVGQFMGDSYLNVIRPLQNRYPDIALLGPADLELFLKNKSPLALVNQIAATISLNRSLIQQFEKDGVFRSEAFQEIEAALENIRIFINAS